MSKLVKHLPWIAPTVAILAVGSGVTDRLNFSFGEREPVSAEPVAAAEAVAPRALAPSPVEAPPVADPSDVASQLAVLLAAAPVAPTPATETEEAEDASTVGGVEVTRARGFSVDALQVATDNALGAQKTQPVPAGVVQTPVSSGAVGADFFANAQANLARDRQCVDDLNALAPQARVYFPSGGVTGEQTGIEQARLLGLLAQQCPGVTIQVVGHSDPSGNSAINQRLSLERAEAVITRVAASGVDTSIFSAVGRGDTQPSNISGPQPSSYYDRRVEFEVVENVVQASFTAPPLARQGRRFRSRLALRGSRQRPRPFR